jgi:hypothetical protein
MKTCKHCKKEYETSKSFLSTSTASTLYCSKECRDAVRKQVNKANKEKAKLKMQQVDNIDWISKVIQSKYKRSAKQRGYSYTLTLDDIKAYYKKPCYYCNSDVNTVSLDRVDNNKGYISDNIVSCCIKCNVMKHTQTQEDFINRCKAIALLH